MIAIVVISLAIIAFIAIMAVRSTKQYNKQIEKEANVIGSFAAVAVYLLLIFSNRITNNRSK